LKRTRNTSSVAGPPPVELWVSAGCFALQGSFGRMGHGPKPRRNGQRIDRVDLPPRAFVATAMQLPVVQPAKRDGKAVADLAPHRPLLGKLDVVGIAGAAAAEEAGLIGHEAQMVAVALAHWLTSDGNFRGAWFGAPSLLRVCILGLATVFHGALANLAEPRRKASFECMAIAGRKLVLQRQHPVRPRTQSLAISELLEL